MRTSGRRALLVGLALACAGAAGCGSGGAGGSTTTTAAATSTTAAATSTASTTAAPTTAAPTTVPPGTDPQPPTTAPPAPPPGEGLVVVVDPGHNGANGAHPEIIGAPVDAGGFEKACNTTGTATDGGVSESSINWSVAQLVRDRLEAAGAEVLMTREDDEGVGPCIDERARVAAEGGADLLVSIHADGAPASAHGFHVLHPALRPGYTDGTVVPSTELAGRLRDALVAAGFTPATYVGTDGLNQRDDLGTLNLARVPAVMLEAGNLRNPSDAGVLTSAEGQGRLADAVVAAVLAHGG